MRDAVRAFDRVFMQQHYVIPDLYSGKHRASYWAKFGMPGKTPRFYTIESTLDAMPAWAVTTWWSKDLPGVGAGGAGGAGGSSAPAGEKRS